MMSERTGDNNVIVIMELMNFSQKHKIVGKKAKIFLAFSASWKVHLHRK